MTPVRQGLPTTDHDIVISYSPKVAPGVVISIGTTQRSKSAGSTKPRRWAASRNVRFSVKASLPIFTALS